MKSLKFTALFLAAIMMLASCGTMNNTGKGALIGGGGGAALGAGIGALIGKKMDKQKAELEKIENAQVSTVTDQNGLQAIKVTFDNGILFKLNSSTLNAVSKTALSQFAASLKNTPETDITIWGHTDNTGTLAVNERISAQRAEAVADFLVQNGIPRSRMTTAGKAYNEPVASNDTEAGRAQNRRVDIYITANENMIKQAEQGTLQ